MYVRQGRFLEAAKSFEKELQIMRGDFGSNSTASSVPFTVSDSPVVGAKNGSGSGGLEVEMDVKGGGNEGEEGPVSRALSNDTALNPPQSLPSNATTPDSTSTAPERKNLSPKEKLKVVALHKRLGAIYAGQLLDVKAAAGHFESVLDLGGDMDRDMRMFFAKNAALLSGTEGDRPVSGLSGSDDTVEAPSVPLEGVKVLRGESSSNDTRGANNSATSSAAKNQGSDSSSAQNRTAKLSPLISPTTPPRATERAGFRNRWVVRSEPVVEPAGGEGEGPGVGQGTDGPVRGMKMGGMGGMRGNEGAAGGGEGLSVGDEGDSRGKGGGNAGESSFESQVRMNEEFEDDDGSGGGGASRAGQSSVLSSLSSSRRGR